MNTGTTTRIRDRLLAAVALLWLFGVTLVFYGGTLWHWLRR